MLWTIVSCGVLGLLIGVRLAVPALLVASAAAVAGILIATLLQGWYPAYAALTALGCLAMLQAGYVAGLVLAWLLARLRQPVSPSNRLRLPK